MFENVISTKKINVTVIVVALLLCSFFGVAAQQETTFNEEDLRVLANAASFEKLKDKTYRLTTISVSYNDGNTIPTTTIKTVFEVIPPERTRYVTETETANGSIRTESIKIGERRFFKNDNEEWKEYNGFGSGSGSGNGSGSSDGKRIQTEKTIERKLKRGVIINNQTVDLYETTHITKYKFLSNIYSVITKSSKWFDKNGLYIKTSDEFENTEMKLISRTTREYEYDLNIKIEAPIIKSESKVTTK